MIHSLTKAAKSALNAVKFTIKENSNLLKVNVLWRVLKLLKIRYPPQ